MVNIRNLQLALCFIILALCDYGCQTSKSESPNILLIITDQQTANALGCAGNMYVRTPSLDKLAETGIRFTNTYVTQPLCLPFRSSFQTGCYPHEIGTISNGTKITGDFPMLGNLVASAGYQCDYIGKWHVGTTPEIAGYPGYSNAGKDHEKTIAAQEYLLKKHEKPFFLTVSFMNPHNVCQLARADAVGTDLPDGSIGLAPNNLDELPPLPVNFEIPENEPTIIRKIWNSSKIHYPTMEWDELTWRQYLWGYNKLVEKVDAEIGKVLSTLEESDYGDNTVVIFTSDHGEGVAMHHWNQKQVLYDQSVKVPLIINWKPKTKKMVYTGLVSNALEIPVTILDIVGSEIPENMHGQSLLPLVEGNNIEERKFVISETMFARGDVNLGATGRMIRTEKYKYCIYDNGENREQLFDMENDPGEIENLAIKPEYKSELNRHRRLIGEWAEETMDTNFPYLSPE